MTTPNGRGTWRAYYGIEDLACSLLCITQDSQGYLWFGTSGRGVLRHDGQVWTTFTMENGLAVKAKASLASTRARGAPSRPPTVWRTTV